MSAPREQIRPLPRQQAAISCPADELLFGGQKGGSKTFFLLLCWSLLLNAAWKRFVETRTPQVHVRIVIFRKNIRDLADMVIKSYRVFRALDPTAEYNQNEKKWKFASGATVEFVHLDGPDDHTGWNGQEIMGLGFDQLEEHEYKVYAFLVAQVRTSDEYYKPYLRVRSTANPGGKHGDWVKKYFIDPCPAGNKIIETEVENADGSKHVVTKAFIPSALKDNPYLNHDGKYEARMRAVLPAHQIKQYLEGDWNVVEGAFFASLIRPEKLFFNFREVFPKGISGSWEMKFGNDWGSTAPAAAIFGTKDNDGRIWVIGEHYKPGITGRTFGESMKNWFEHQKWSDERRYTLDDLYGLLDLQAWGRYGADGAAAADGIAHWGWRLFPANKDRYAGIEQICERLQPWADGYPGVRIAADMCPNLARTIQTVRINPHDSKDYDPDDEAHAVDGMRFLLMDWPFSPGAQADPRDAEVARWERIIKDARRRQRSDEYQVTGSGGYD